MKREDVKKFKLPDEPGVYIFRDAKRKILYVGKAASLRDRVRSYFALDIAKTRSSAIASMVESAKSITHTKTDSVLEALILEANLIKQHMPPFNIRDKDNKSFNYLLITKEDYPRVLVVRGRELFQDWDTKKLKHVFGPFPQGGSLAEAVKMVRRIFPYRDTCVPLVGKPCFNCQIGLCPGVCAGTISKIEYGRIISKITLLFSGKMGSLKTQLKREMIDFAKAEKFEAAARAKRQFDAITHIRDVALIKDEHRVSAGGAIRIEAYDVAHTGGTQTVGVMTVVVGGEAVKKDYRMFKIKTVTNDDTNALAEMLERRLAHTEWGMPRIIVVDGGKGQLNAAKRVLAKAGVSIAIVGVVKDERHRPEKLIGDDKSIKFHEKEILQANAEAHRFAINYHRKRARKALIL